MLHTRTGEEEESTVSYHTPEWTAPSPYLMSVLQSPLFLILGKQCTLISPSYVYTFPGELCEVG